MPPRPTAEIIAIIESEFGCPIHEVFKTFDETPLGAASIGQAHAATLLDGTEVVVKVQYPDVEKYFRIDIATCRFFMEQVYGLENNENIAKVLCCRSVEPNHVAVSSQQLCCISCGIVMDLSGMFRCGTTTPQALRQNLTTRKRLHCSAGVQRQFRSRENIRFVCFRMSLMS